MTTFCDPAQIVNRKSPGKVGGWIAFWIACACLVTFLAVTVGVDLVFSQIDHAVDRGWVPYGLTFITAFCMLASWLPPARLSRALRVAVLLPVTHALVIALAWPAWSAVSRFVRDRSATSALVTQFPMLEVAGATVCVFAAFALLVARRREWLHGFLMLALTELLLLGLWLPVTCAVWPGGGEWWTLDEPLLAELAPRIALCVLPPTLAAFAFTALALRRPRLLFRLLGLTTALVVTAFVIALVLRVGASARELVLYANLLPLLIAAMLVALVALLGFGAGFVWTGYRARRVMMRHGRSDGVIVDDDRTPVAGFEITSWLRGPRVVQRRFAVSIAGATIPVSGAYLVAPLPAATTQLATGECYAVLRPGDRVTIAGHADAAGDPFRTSAAPLAGELFVAPAERTTPWFTQVALAMWRPCVAYLWIVVAVALPALAALAAL